MDGQNEVREDLIRRLAKNRWEMRMHFKWKLHENEKDDWLYAESVINKEDMERIINERKDDEASA